MPEGKFFSSRQVSNGIMGVSSNLDSANGSHPARPRSFVDSSKEIIYVSAILQGIPRYMLLGPRPTCDRCFIVNKIIC